MYGLAEGLLKAFRTEFNCDSIPDLSLVNRPLHQRFNHNRSGPLSSTAKVTLVNLLLFLGITTVLDFVQRHTR